MKVRGIYLDKKKEIQAKLAEFNQGLYRKNDKEIFAELAFCILTPQTKAKTCWQAVEYLLKENALFVGKEGEILRGLSKVRFKNKKAKYIYLARNYFKTNGRVNIKARLKQFKDVFEARDWLVNNLKGIGYKEASHFLRNIGLGKDLAILDRHILKNLKLLKVIGNVPGSLSRKRYLEIEKKMAKFANRVNVPVECLDLVLWYKETGEIFK